jgi:pimeloyl-ACP methyl ester carboxylesterase
MIEPFRIAVPQPEVDDLRRRLRATRWPAPQPVADWSQGVPMTVLAELCHSWAEEYDWRATEDRLNRLPQIRTTIDGTRMHAVPARSGRGDAIPVILTHGWPGSFLEFEQVLPLLVDPPAREPAFHVIVPSLPGYGFSDAPTNAGWDIHRIARAWCELMARLGYTRFLAAGSDWGTSISTSIALQMPERLIGLHLVPPLVAPDRQAHDLSPDERRALADLDERTRTGSAYSAVHATRPQTIGYGLTDSPSGLAAWIGETLWTWTDRRAGGGPRTDQILDDLSLYSFTSSAASSVRLYWESIAEVSRWFMTAAADTIDTPTGCSVFPVEVPRPSRRWAERRFTNIVHWGEPPRGGHFAAWEQPICSAPNCAPPRWRAWRRSMARRHRPADHAGSNSPRTARMPCGCRRDAVTMAVVDLFGDVAPPPTPPPPRRGLAASAGVVGFLVGIPIVTVAAVAGFVRGRRGAPRLEQAVGHDKDFLRPIAFLAQAVSWALLYSLGTTAAIAAVALLAMLVHHRRHTHRRD